jgi:hypothetical protein
MTANPEIIRLNLRYYERLLTGNSATYTPEQARILLETAMARLPRAEAEALQRKA